MVKNLKINFTKNNIGLGRRKKATARVFLILGTGEITINKLCGKKYLQYNKKYIKKIFQPLELLNLNRDYNVISLANGGGLTGQTEAIQLGLTRLLTRMNPKNSIILKENGLLTRNPRVKERKKYGLRKARKAKQYSKR